MPIYGYICTQCGHTFEVVQSMTDDALRECPVCMGPLRKQIYPVGVIYKGSGFYTTDYKNSSAGGGRSETKAGSDGSGKSDSKESTSGGSGEKSAGSSEQSGDKGGEKGGEKGEKSPDKAAS